MADEHVAISGEFCSLFIETKAVAATRTFTLSIDRASYGNFVARGTIKWRTNYVADIGATIDGDGLIVLEDTSPEEYQFDDLFTYMVAGAPLDVIFTLKIDSVGGITFVYTGEAYLTALSTSNPQFGESTYTFSLLFTGAIAQVATPYASP